MKRLGNNFNEWDREFDRLQAMGEKPHSLKGLDDQSHLYKNLLKDTNHINEKLFVTILWASILGLMLVIYLFVAFG